MGNGLSVPVKKSLAKQPTEQKEKEQYQGGGRMGNVLKDTKEIGKDVDQREEENESEQAPFSFAYAEN